MVYAEITLLAKLEQTQLMEGFTKPHDWHTQTTRHRPTFGNSAAAASAAQERDRAGSLLFRCAFVSRLCNGGYSARADSGWHRCTHVLDTYCNWYCHSPPDRWVLVSTDDPRLSKWRWCLYCRPREPGRVARSYGCRRAPDRLCTDGGRLDLFRCLCYHIAGCHMGFSSTGKLSGRTRVALYCLRDDHQLAGGEGEWCLFCGTHLSLHYQHDWTYWVGDGQCGAWGRPHTSYGSDAYCNTSGFSWGPLAFTGLFCWLHCDDWS